jgi:hypothetical protein
MILTWNVHEKRQNAKAKIKGDDWILFCLAAAAKVAESCSTHKMRLTWASAITSRATQSETLSLSNRLKVKFSNAILLNRSSTSKNMYHPVTHIRN